MVGFYIALGKQGSGKTLFITKCLVDEYKKNPDIRIFSNYNLFGIDFTPISFDIKKENDRVKICNGKEKYVLDILDVLDQDENYFNNSIMLIDEIHTYFDSLDFMKANNRKIQKFFSQLRKRNILLLATTQYLLNLDVRIRRQLFYCFQMTRLNDNLFECEVNEIDGYYTKYIRTEVFDLKEYYDYYDTNEIIK